MKTHQISLMKNINQIFQSLHKKQKLRKNYKWINKLVWNVSAVSFSFGELTSLIFVAYLIITNNTNNSNNNNNNNNNNDNDNNNNNNDNKDHTLPHPFLQWLFVL